MNDPITTMMHELKRECYANVTKCREKLFHFAVEALRVFHHQEVTGAFPTI